MAVRSWGVAWGTKADVGAILQVPQGLDTSLPVGVSLRMYK